MRVVRQKWVRVTHGVRVRTFLSVLSDVHLQDVWESQLTWRAWVSQKEIVFLASLVLIIS